MRVYIAYKFRCVENKDQLITDLNTLSDSLKKAGYNTFILGRDVQKWSQSSSSLVTTIPQIIVNIIKSDVVFAYVNTCVKSNGLPFELFFAKLIGKKIVYAVKNDLDYSQLGISVKNEIKFSDINDLAGKLSTIGTLVK